MNERTDIWTYLLVTAVTVLIWSWAAAETQIDRAVPVSLIFEVGDPDQWEVLPRRANVIITAKGTERALNQLEALDEITVVRPAEIGRQQFNVLEAIRGSSELDRSPITVLASDTRELEIEVDERIAVPARIALRSLAGVETREPPEVSPAQIMITGPSRLFPNQRDLTVDVAVDDEEVSRLEPGVQHTLENVAIRLPDALAANSLVSFEPTTVTLTFTLQAFIREVTPPGPVRVQIAGSPEDDALVTVEPKLLRNVVVTVPHELGQMIESNEATVFAVVYLKSSEKEARIESKPVTCFIALLPDGSATLVDAQIDGSDQKPEITITIEDREAVTP